MPDRRVIVFRSRLRPEHEADFHRHAEQVHARTADVDRVFMEYVRHVDPGGRSESGHLHSGGEPDLPVAEVLEVREGLIVASRVVHG